MVKKIRLNGKKLIFSPEAVSVPPDSHGVIFPAENGFIITDKEGKETLFLKGEGDYGAAKTKNILISWFLSVRHRRHRRYFIPASDEALRKFRLHRLSYNELMQVALKIHRECISAEAGSRKQRNNSFVKSV